MNSQTMAKRIHLICSLVGNLAGIIIGIISIVHAYNIKDMSIGAYESNEYYGGDAYTGIQQASAQAANNVQDLADIVREGFFTLFLIIGIALICFCVIRLVKTMIDAAVSNNAGRSDSETSVRELLTSLIKRFPAVQPAQSVSEPKQPQAQSEPEPEQPQTQPVQEQEPSQADSSQE